MSDVVQHRAVCIDFQGFKVSANKFIAKEVCITITTATTTTMMMMAANGTGVEPNSWQKYHFLIKPPYGIDRCTWKTKQHINYLCDKYHGLDWRTGETTFSEFEQLCRRVMFENNTVVFVKGYEKIKWLNQMMPGTAPHMNIVDVEMLGFTTGRIDLRPNKVVSVGGSSGDGRYNSAADAAARTNNNLERINMTLANTRCPYHDIRHFHCASVNVSRINDWLINNNLMFPADASNSI